MSVIYKRDACLSSQCFKDSWSLGLMTRGKVDRHVRQIYSDLSVKIYKLCRIHHRTEVSYLLTFLIFFSFPRGWLLVFLRCLTLSFHFIKRLIGQNHFYLSHAKYTWKMSRAIPLTLESNDVSRWNVFRFLWIRKLTPAPYLIAVIREH